MNPEDKPTPSVTSPDGPKKRNHIYVIGAIVVVAVIAGLVVAGALLRSKHGSSAAETTVPTDVNVTDPVQKGRLLSNGKCTGTGTTQLTHAPLDAATIGVIAPYGLMVQDHVTPVDHQYYYQANLNARKDTYKVYAPADGHIVDVSHYGDDSDPKERWRIVIAYSCTHLSYYDLMTDFAFKDQLKARSDGSFEAPNIAVKAGEVVGSVGGQSLDFAVWDTTKINKNLLYANAYNNAEPWKVNTVPPLDYFTSGVKAIILPKYARQAEPRDGLFGYDKAGKLVGTWFLEGSNGYAGSTDPNNHNQYYQGHLSLAYDYIDTSALTVSTGNYNGQAAQFAVVGNTPDFGTITKNTGLVKYQLAGRGYITANGSTWNGSSTATGIRMRPTANQATLLVQMIDDNHIKIEFFPGKTPAQVTAFTSAAKTYDRGQDAKPLVDPNRTP